MRDSMKMTVPYQIWTAILTHIEAAGISFVFQAVAFWYFIGRNGFKEILGTVFTIVYAGFIYHVVRKMAIRDYKSYTPLKPSVIKGIMFGVIVALITMAMHVIWLLLWRYCSSDGSLIGMPAIIYNFVFTLWTFPFYGIMGASEGHITIIGQILMYGVPVVSAAAGYLSAKYNIDILDRFQQSIYEKNDE